MSRIRHILGVTKFLSKVKSVKKEEEEEENDDIIEKKEKTDILNRRNYL